jgi:hypothetical protein
MTTSRVRILTEPSHERTKGEHQDTQLGRLTRFVHTFPRKEEKAPELMTLMDLHVAEITDVIHDLLAGERIGESDDNSGTYAYRMVPRFTADVHVIALDLVLPGTGAVARTAKITVELL